MILVIGGIHESVPIWFERKFEFTFPIELLPSLGARLRGSPARLEDTLRGRSQEILSRKANEKWSAQETIGAMLQRHDSCCGSRYPVLFQTAMREK